MIGDGYTMGVTAQVTEHLAGSAERWLGIDDTIAPVEAAQQLAELLVVGQCGGRSSAV